jgi:hypothetical protein
MSMISDHKALIDHPTDGYIIIIIIIIIIITRIQLTSNRKRSSVQPVEPTADPSLLTAKHCGAGVISDLVESGTP